MFVLSDNVHLSYVIVLALLCRSFSDLRRMSKTRKIIINFINNFRRRKDNFIRLTRLHVTIARDAFRNEDCRLIISIGTIRYFRYFIVFARIYVTRARVNFYGVNYFYTTMFIYRFCGSNGASTVAIRYLYVDIYFRMFLPFRWNDLYFFFAKIYVGILMRRCANGSSSCYCCDTSSYFFILGRGNLQLYRYVLRIWNFVHLFLFYRFCVVFLLLFLFVCFSPRGWIFCDCRQGLTTSFFILCRGAPGLFLLFGGPNFASMLGVDELVLCYFQFYVVFMARLVIAVVVLGHVSVLGCGGLRRIRLSFSPGLGYFFKRGNVKGAGLLSTICFLSFYGDTNGPVSSRGVYRSTSFFIVRKFCRTTSKAPRRVCYNVGEHRGGRFGQGGGRCAHLSSRVNFLPLIVISPTSSRLVTKNDSRHQHFVSIIVSRCSGRCLSTLVQCGGTLIRQGALLGDRRPIRRRLFLI